MAKVTAKDRKEHGISGKFPVATRIQALSAIKLRHHGKGVTASRVLAHVSRRARAMGWADVLRKVAEARERDKKK
jgi:hypothetical protein